MDPESCSDAKMSGHDPIALSKLDKSIEIAEMSATKINHYAVPSPYYSRVKTPSQIAKEGFPKFKQLPAELRSKIWKDAMPSYGIYTALMLGREEPMPQQPPPPAPMAFRVVYRLEPVPRDQQDDELRIRLDTMRAIQFTNSEAASEVQRAFPTTINFTRGKLRFNAEHDSLSLSDSQCHLARGFLKRFTRYTHGAVTFADDWHKIPRTMLFDNEWLWHSFEDLYASRFLGVLDVRAAEGFMKFLADCTNLRTLGLVYFRVCEHYYFDPKQHYDRDNDDGPYDLLGFCHFGPVMQGSFYTRYQNEQPYRPLQDFVSGFKGLKALVSGLIPGQKFPTYLQPMRPRSQELGHLRIKAVVPASPKFQRWLKDWMRIGTREQSSDVEW